MKSLFLSVATGLLLFAACRPNKAEMVDLPTDFTDFYEQFLRDSAYQMAHISFPLEGLPSYADSTTVTDHSFRWTQDTWVLHQPFDVDNREFERTFRVISEQLIEEIIRQKKGQMGTIRRFYKSGATWSLIYFSGLNAMQIRE